MPTLVEMPNADLLIYGNIEKWLNAREENLLYTANEIKNGSSISKTLGLIGLAGSALMVGINPMATVAALLCAGGYVGAVLQDKAITNKLSFLPFLRGSLSDTVGTAFNAELRINHVQGSEIDDLRQYLPYKESYELVMLTTDRLAIIDNLTQVAPENREDSYLWHVKKFIMGMEDKPALDIRSQVFTQVIDGVPAAAIASTAPTVMESPVVSANYAWNSPTVISSPPQPSPAPSFIKKAPDAVQNGMDILDSLVKDADKSKLGGCVVLAAPGAGKTTFFGTAWGRMRKVYGDRFNALAIVVKEEDVEGFKGVCECYCIERKPVEVVLRILEFVSQSTRTTDKISRLFFDDYLTLQDTLKTELSGVYIDDDYKPYYSKPKGVKVTSLLAKLNTALNKMWLVGRQFNTALWVSSHSSNVEKLAFTGGSQARSVGQMVFLARTDKRDFINLALSNQFLIPDDNRREELRRQLSHLKSSDNEPLILGNFDNWTLGIVPNKVHEEYVAYRAAWENKFAEAKPIDDITLKAFHAWLKRTFPDGVAVDDPKVVAYLERVQIAQPKIPSLIQALRQKELVDCSDGLLRAL